MRTRKLRGGVRTGKTARQKRLSMLRKTKTARSRARSRQSMQVVVPKIRGTLKSGKVIRTSIDYLKKIVRILRKMESSAEESVNDDERYELHTFIAATLEDRTVKLFRDNNIHMPVTHKNSDDPFDYIQDLIKYIEDIIQKTNDVHNPQLMPVSSWKLADVLEEMEKQVNKDIEEDEMRRKSRLQENHSMGNNLNNNANNANNNSDDGLLELFNKLKV